jgi:hypothetical protein
MKRLALVVVALVLMTAGARAQQSCEDDANVGPNRVYILAADTQVPVLKTLGKLLRQLLVPVTIVYTPNGSCNNITYLYNGTFTSNATAGGTFYVPGDPNWTPAMAAPTCIPVAGQKPDLAISIVFPDSTDCPAAPPRPSSVAVTQGPVQAFVFAVPGGVGTSAGSTQRTITAEEAYLVLGIGALNAMVTPWSDPQYIYGRPATKGTQISIGANIGVAAAKWKLLADPMHQIDQSTAVANAIANQLTTGNAEQTLGILGVEIYDSQANRARLHSLSFRAFGQNHSYWPDSAPTAFDKRNVRDGHYSLWSYVQYLAPQGAAGAANANAQAIIDMLSGKVLSNLTFEPLDAIIANGLVPACAMKVSRTVEGGPLSLAAPPEPCGCYYEAKVPMGKTSCAACDNNTPCASGTCRHGYCEAH